MSIKRHHLRPVYGVIALLILTAEIMIATVFSEHAFVRGSVGDILVAGLLYYLVCTFYPVNPLRLGCVIFGFACAIEGLQFIGLADILGLPRGSMLSILVGNTFSWEDIGMYAVGSVLAVGIDYGCFRKIER